jgi:hypothetical protein
MHHYLPDAVHLPQLIIHAPGGPHVAYKSVDVTKAAQPAKAVPKSPEPK